jgi:hypothetical protein
MTRWCWLLVGAGLLFAGLCLPCVGGLMIIGLLGQPYSIQDQLDQRALRRHFDLPSGLELVEYDGYPAEVGFGQREGLDIRAVYQLSDGEAEKLGRRFAEKGWSPLPIPADIQLRVRRYVAPDPLELTSGLYLCRTAGHNVLHAWITRPCAMVERQNDVILGVFDAETNRLHLQVSSGY